MGLFLGSFRGSNEEVKDYLHVQDKAEVRGGGRERKRGRAASSLGMLAALAACCSCTAVGAEAGNIDGGSHFIGQVQRGKEGGVGWSGGGGLGVWAIGGLGGRLRGGGGGVAKPKMTSYTLHGEVVGDAVPANVLSEKRKDRIVKQVGRIVPV